MISSHKRQPLRLHFCIHVASIFPTDIWPIVVDATEPSIDVKIVTDENCVSKWTIKNLFPLHSEFALFVTFSFDSFQFCFAFRYRHISKNHTALTTSCAVFLLHIFPKSFLSMISVTVISPAPTANMAATIIAYSFQSPV